MAKRVVLVTGPVRSGKSEWAEGLAKRSGRQVVYVATSMEHPEDGEWQDRIARHRDRRPAEWQTLEVAVDLAKTVAATEAETCLLVDSLGTWLANILDQDDTQWEQTIQELLISLQQSAGEVILVAEETGWGIVPAYPLGRLFRDRLGVLTRRVGAIADAVYLVAAGYAIDLKQLGQRVGEDV